jgi:hypothetical protein
MTATTGLVKVGLGDNAQLAYLVQSAYGAIDTTPAWIVLPFTSAEYSVQAEQLPDNSMTGDRNELEPRTGTVNASVSVSGKFRPESLDSIIEAAAQGTWAVKYNITGLTVTVAAVGAGGGFSFTRSAGSWITDGVEVGDIVTFSGFDAATAAANNGTFEVTAVDSATKITCGHATGLVAVTSAASITATTGQDYVKVGSTRRAVAWEVYHSDTDEYVRIKDTEIASFSISLAPNGDVTFQLQAVGGQELDLGADIGEKISGATYTETTKPFFDSFNGTVSLDGSTGIYFSGMNPSINNNSTPLFALGSRYPFAVSHGKMVGDMSLTAYYTDKTIKSKYQNEDSLNLKIRVKYEDEDLEDTSFYEFEYPSCKITNFGRPIGGSGELVDNLTVKPYKNTDLDSSFRIRKFNKA